ncbi:MAG: AMP-binding enzyme, partial [Alphaproteobacteria bacterium]
VSESLTIFPGVKEANVYGVKVGAMEGRAGMAALVTEDEIDLEGLYAHVADQLPRYARPVFLRLQPEIDITGTFKQRKVDLVKQGFDPDAVSEPIYFDDPEAGRYVVVDTELARAIEAGKKRL